MFGGGGGMALALTQSQHNYFVFGNYSERCRFLPFGHFKTFIVHVLFILSQVTNKYVVVNVMRWLNEVCVCECVCVCLSVCLFLE